MAITNPCPRLLARCQKVHFAHPEMGVKMLENMGVTETAILEAEARGISFQKIWELIAQYGPAAWNIIQNIISSLNTP